MFGIINIVDNIVYGIVAGGKATNANDLLNQAISEITNLNKGEIFLLRDLFKGYEWNRIPRSDRLLLGTLFLNHIQTSNGRINVAEKTSSKQQRYIVQDLG